MKRDDTPQSSINPQETLEFLKSFSRWLSQPEGQSAAAGLDAQDSLALGKALMRQFRAYHRN